MSQVNNQFIRRFSLTLGNDSQITDLSDLHCTFSIKQADKETFQSATVRIYNISEKTLNALAAQEYLTMTIQAGYVNGNYGTIFLGVVIQARFGRDNPTDTYLDIIAGEGYIAQQQVMSLTMSAGATMQDVAEQAAQSSGLHLKPYDFIPGAKLPRGKTIYGMARDTLHIAAATAGFSYFYDNKGNIAFVPLESSIPGTATVINSDTGMIGWPEQTQAGIKVRTLLNPLLDVASAIKIDNKSIRAMGVTPSYQWINDVATFPHIAADGLYRIYVIEHSGDTRGNAWYSDITGLSLNGDTGQSSLFLNGQF
jgi:hypothetical protein